jgi:hypothetical protein
VVHAAVAGPKTIVLPAPLTNAITGSNTISVNMQIGDTNWYYLK